MLVRADRIEKEYGIQEIFEIEQLTIEDGARIGLVGKNGTGKSTLLGVLSGRIPVDAGQVKRYCEIAEIRQAALPKEEARQQYEDCQERVYEWNGQALMSQVGLKDSAIASGGERMRLAIAAAFSMHTPLLLADEPTTNLDMEGVALLEHMLMGYRGALVLVSHDRKLLDDVCTQIWELEDGKLRVFDGNYTAWTKQKELEREHQQFEYEQYTREKRHLEQAIVAVEADAKNMLKHPRKMGRSEWMLYKGIATQQQKHVSNRGTAMKSRMDHLERKEKPTQLPNVSMSGMHVNRIKARYAAKAERITVAYGDHVVLDEAELLVESGKKTFLIGENGAGKSTLLQAFIERSEGVTITEDAKGAYFSQNLMELREDGTVLENVCYDAVEPEPICRAVLANLYMSKGDLHKKVSVLSGGERVKTALARLLVSGANLLILDEPTNHMDVYTMEGLERMLAEFSGTLLVVSHDRRLVEKLADVIYEVRDGKCRKVDKTNER